MRNTVKPPSDPIETIRVAVPTENLGGPASNAWQVAASTGWQAAKQNRVPAMVMWLFGMGVIIGYFFVPPVHDLLDSVGRVKELFGWKFSLCFDRGFWRTDSGNHCQICSTTRGAGQPRVDRRQYIVVGLQRSRSTCSINFRNGYSERRSISVPSHLKRSVISS